MKKTIKLIALVLVVVMAMAAFAGCGKKKSDSDWAYIEDKGNLVIGITEFDPANYYDENGKLVGFDTDMAIAACEKLGLEAEFVIIDWDSKELELESKNIDCIWNMMGINDERKEYADFTAAYMVNGQVAVTKAENAGNYSDAASLNQAGLVCTFEEGSTGDALANELLADAELTPVAGQTDAMLEVKAGTADFAVVDFLTASAMIASADYADLKVVEGLLLDTEYDAVAFRKGSDAVEKMDEALKELFDDGTAMKIAADYNLTEQVVLTPDV